MNRNYRRYLVAGVSLGALSALPVGAATTSTVNCDLGAPAGCSQAPGADDTVDLTLIISDAGNQETYGVIDVTPTAANALVATTADGKMEQTGLATGGTTAAPALAFVEISNAGTATIGAIATASGAAAQAANANVTGVAINQVANATGTAGSALAVFDNSGSLNVLAD